MSNSVFLVRGADDSHRARIEKVVYVLLHVVHLPEMLRVAMWLVEGGMRGVSNVNKSSVFLGVRYNSFRGWPKEQ